MPLTLTATLLAARTTNLTIPSGIRFATNYASISATGTARRFLFETIAPTTFKKPAVPADLTQIAVAAAREYLEVKNEVLGTSDGTPNQVFPFRPVHVSLGLPLGRPTPVLLYFVHPTPAYQPNPGVTVSGFVSPWKP